MPKRVAIVGGGVTGLAAAYRLERTTSAEVELFEASDRLGGKVQTLQIADRLVELGPDSFFGRKSGIMALVEELGLETVEPRHHEFFLLIDGELHRAPRGLATFTASARSALASCAFLSDRGRERALLEPTIPAGSVADESIRAFFSRRFGDEFSRKVAEPLLAGTHGGDPDRLSMRALYAPYLERERANGSLTGGEAKPTSAGPAFLSFPNGMGALVQALTAGLSRTRIFLGTPGSALSAIEADQILLALPANVAANLTPQPTSELLRRIPHQSSAIVTLAFPREAVCHPLDGNGFLTPCDAPGPVTGATWSSQKWPGRAPQDEVLLRAFLGGARERLRAASSRDLAHEALSAIRPLLGIRGEPRLVHVAKWLDALPQYELGHTERVQEIESTLPEHVTLAGTSYRGVGIPDSIRQGLDAAERIAQRL